MNPNFTAFGWMAHQDKQGNLLAKLDTNGVRDAFVDSRGNMRWVGTAYSPARAA